MESSAATSSVVFEPQPTTQQQLDRVVARLQAGARKFVMLSLDHRMQLARAMQEGYLRVAKASVEACRSRDRRTSMSCVGMGRAPRFGKRCS